MPPPYTPLSLCAFIGHLFAEGLLPQMVVQQCLHYLVVEIRPPASINHLHAIRTLVDHSSEKLWRGEKAGKILKDFVVMIGQRVSAVGMWGNVGIGASVGPVRKEEVDKLVKVFLPFSTFLNCR